MEVTLKKPKFLMRIITTLDSDKNSCLGEQLAQILSCISVETKDCNWYVFDVDYFNKSQSKLFATSTNIYHFENTDELVSHVVKIDQFLSGVFIAIKKDVLVEWDIERLPETEMDKFMQHDEAELEIRAFDTSYFEICGMNPFIEAKIKSCFPILNIKSNQIELFIDQITEFPLKHFFKVFVAFFAYPIILVLSGIPFMNNIMVIKFRKLLPTKCAMVVVPFFSRSFIFLKKKSDSH